MRFVADVEEGIFSIAELCERYGVSRKTGYKWIGRFEQEGPVGLQDRPRIASHIPHRTEDSIIERLLQYRRRHSRWGPKKLIERLRFHHPEVAWPAPSTAGDWLKRNGLVQARRARRRLFPAAVGPLPKPTLPNDLWTADFKGQFKTGDGLYCYPLTVADGASRFLLEVRALQAIHRAAVRQSFQRLFQQYGLPSAIRTDNGSPFASTGLSRLSRLSVWWTRLGILHQRIAPAHPEQNGSHERMHLTLKSETTRPPQANRAAQQRRFDSFRHEYNGERPHEALAMKTPSSLYRPSPRSLPSHLPEPVYPGHYQLRRVGSNGCILFAGRRLFLSNALAGELVALEEIDDALFSLFFGPLLLARFDRKTHQLHQGSPN